MTRSNFLKPFTQLTQLESLERDLLALANPEKAKFLMRFFKTGPGSYGEGDCFLGIQVPAQRRLARKYRDLSVADISQLLASKWHEYRLTGLLIALLQYPKNRKQIYHFLLQPEHFKAMNNWDLVDVIVPGTIGDYLWRHPDQRSILDTWIYSADLWERRIALLVSQAFIRQGDTGLIVDLAEKVLADREDLIHKASGWMLREAGKRDLTVLIHFLEAHAARMPRTMLRYAIEKLSPEQRQDYLSRKRLNKPVLE